MTQQQTPEVWIVEPYWENNEIVEWRALMNVDRHPDGRIRSFEDYEGFQDELEAREFVKELNEGET